MFSRKERRQRPHIRNGQYKKRWICTTVSTPHCHSNVLYRISVLVWISFRVTSHSLFTLLGERYNLISNSSIQTLQNLGCVSVSYWFSAVQRIPIINLSLLRPASYICFIHDLGVVLQPNFRLIS